jgi:hypothetical protein
LKTDVESRFFSDRNFSPQTPISVLLLNNLSRQKQIPLRWLIGLSAALLLIILAAGLRPRGFRPANRVSWIRDQPGIRFSGFGIAYTDPSDGPVAYGESGPEGLSIEMALKPAGYRGRRFEFILALHNGQDSDQLVVGQWRSWLIVMNGDDYAYKEKINRISVDAAAASPTTQFVTITSGLEGTEIFLNGKSVGSKRDLALRIPNGDKVRLLLGNSVYGTHPWRGDLYGLALYRHTLTSRQAALHFNRWLQDRSFAFAGDDNPFALYLFNETAGSMVPDHAGGKFQLEIPSQMQVLEKRILAVPWHNFNFNRSFMIDAIVNLIGFIPFGFILYATLVRAGGTFEKRGILTAAAFCFLVSCALEILQAWIPSRSSSMLDLVLNTLGGWTGAIGCRILLKAAGIQRLVRSTVD